MPIEITDAILRRCLVPLECGGHVKSADTVFRKLRGREPAAFILKKRLDTPMIINGQEYNTFPILFHLSVAQPALDGHRLETADGPSANEKTTAASFRLERRRFGNTTRIPWERCVDTLLSFVTLAQLTLHETVVSDTLFSFGGDGEMYITLHDHETNNVLEPVSDPAYSFAYTAHQ